MFGEMPFELTAVICERLGMGIVWQDMGDGFMQFGCV